MKEFGNSQYCESCEPLCFWDGVITYIALLLRNTEEFIDLLSNKHQKGKRYKPAAGGNKLEP